MLSQVAFGQPVVGIFLKLEGQRMAKGIFGFGILGSRILVLTLLQPNSGLSNLEN